MTKKIVLTTVTALCMTTSAMSSDIYVKLGLGYVDVSVSEPGLEFDSGMSVNLAVGKSINNFDIELEYVYDKGDWTNNLSSVSGDTKSNIYFLNGFYNIDINSVVKPYVGAGLGYGKYDDSYIDDKVKSYQGIIGGSFNSTEKIDINLEYRYRTSNVTGLDLDTNSLIAAIKYKF